MTMEAGRGQAEAAAAADADSDTDSGEEMRLLARGVGGAYGGVGADGDKAPGSAWRAGRLLLAALVPLALTAALHQAMFGQALGSDPAESIGHHNRPAVHLEPAEPLLQLGLNQKLFRNVSQVVLAPADRPDRLVVRFTVEEHEMRRSARNCRAPAQAFAVSAWPGQAQEPAASATEGLSQAIAEHVGCVVSKESGTYLWHYYVAILGGLEPGTMYSYAIGQVNETESQGVFQHKLRTPPRDHSDWRVLAVGDTGTDGRNSVLGSIESNELDTASFVIHVGDMAYVSNTGVCYGKGQLEPECAPGCPASSPDCHGRERFKDSDFANWAKFLRILEPLSSHLPMVSSMGNHDNDLQWFFKFRPPHMSSFPGVQAHDLDPAMRALLEKFDTTIKGEPGEVQSGHLTELLQYPWFYSVDAGPMHIIELQSEDNGINAYEAWDGSEIDIARWNSHFGRGGSAQFAWLNRDLARVDRSKTPWLIAFTHRPPIHNSVHHPSCSRGGDWYKCKFREEYGMLFEQHKVDLVFNGHSHHYSRTYPIALQNQAETVLKGSKGGPVYLIVGTGGFKLSDGFAGKKEWMAFATGRSFGYGMLHIRDAASADWYFRDSATNQKIDSTVFTHDGLPRGKEPEKVHLPTPAPIVPTHTSVPTKAPTPFPTPLPTPLPTPPPTEPTNPLVVGLGLDATKYLTVSQVVLSPGATASEVYVLFTAEGPSVRRKDKKCSLASGDRPFIVRWREQDSQAMMSQTPAAFQGCVVSRDSGKFAWFFFATPLSSLSPGKSYVYAIGQEGEKAGEPYAGNFSAAPADPRQMEILALGDTGREGREQVLSAIATRGALPTAMIHVGDHSYATASSSECRNNDGPECAYNCPQSKSDCKGREFETDERFEIWKRYFELLTPISSRVPLMTTMGNHDNDLIYYYKFRPPLLTSGRNVAENQLAPAVRKTVKQLSGKLRGTPTGKQAAAMHEVLREPLFYSVDLGGVHIVSIQTEDNSINPHEAATDVGPLLAAQQQRFDTHFGPSSPQYKWLEADLMAVDREKTPWLVLFTHRPLFHASLDHPSCSVTGDWFKCELRKLYMPLFEEHGVNLVLLGHSHQYSRSHPLKLVPGTNGTQVQRSTEGAPVYAIVGTGGAGPDIGYAYEPKWAAARNDTAFGVASIRPQTSQALAWEFSAVRNGALEVLDVAVLQRGGVCEPIGGPVLLGAPPAP